MWSLSIIYYVFLAIWIVLVCLCVCVCLCVIASIYICIHMPTDYVYFLYWYLSLKHVIYNQMRTKMRETADRKCDIAVRNHGFTRKRLVCGKTRQKRRGKTQLCVFFKTPCSVRNAIAVKYWKTLCSYSANPKCVMNHS